MKSTQDVNECDNSPCDAKAQCSNTDGGFECECNAGFYGTGESRDDINECALEIIRNYKIKVYHLISDLARMMENIQTG